MSTTYFFAGVPVVNYAESLAWYGRFFGRPPDVVVADNESMWRVTDTSWVYVVADASRAGNGLLTWLVNDFDDTVAALGERGIAPGPIETVPGKYRKVAVTDPDGNKLSIGEALGESEEA